jgi:hypothetical protein
MYVPPMSVHYQNVQHLSEVICALYSSICCRVKPSVKSTTPYAATPSAAPAQVRRVSPLDRCAQAACHDCGCSGSESRGLHSQRTSRRQASVKTVSACTRILANSEASAQATGVTGLEISPAPSGFYRPSQLRRGTRLSQLPASAARHLYHSAPRLRARLERAA